MKKSAHVYYSGSVQGVGFRFTAERFAQSLGLAGWVKNLHDGRVEILLEGKEAVIKEFLQKVETVFKDYIRDTQTEWSEATDELETFDIRF